jgi:hypothetical protein
LKLLSLEAVAVMRLYWKSTSKMHSIAVLFKQSAWWDGSTLKIKALDQSLFQKQRVVDRLLCWLASWLVGWLKFGGKQFALHVLSLRARSIILGSMKQLTHIGGLRVIFAVSPQRYATTTRSSSCTPQQYVVPFSVHPVRSRSVRERMLSDSRYVLSPHDVQCPPKWAGFQVEIHMWAPKEIAV